MGIAYSFKLAIKSILHEKWINLLSSLTIAAGLLISALTILAIYNIDITTKRLPEKFSLMVYLQDNLSQQEIEQAISDIRRVNSIEGVKYISKDNALKELKSTLKDTEYVFDNLGENPLPDTVEVKLKASAIGPDTVKKISATLKGIYGVHEIEYGEKFLSSIYSFRVGIKSIGIVFIVIMSIGMLFVCYSTVKILFYRRLEEIETYKLLGATKWFIRMPFLIEGAVIGSIGGLLSLMGMLFLYYLVLLKLNSMFPLFKSIILPMDVSYILPFLGCLIGIIGSAIAIGRIRY